MDDVFKITPDVHRAKDLLEMALDRRELIKIIPRSKAYKLIEEYYEIIKELLTAIMYLDGYKTLSHIKLIEYFTSNYSILTSRQVNLLNELRRLRNSIMYYGAQVSENFLVNNEDEIRGIIRLLIDFVKIRLES